MMKKRTFLLPCVLLSCFSQQLFSNLTTLQYWDPSPIYAANNYLMPPNSQLVNQRKARKKDMKPDDKRLFSISLSGFAQAASRAYDWYGCNIYQSYCGNTGQIGGQMGDFRGTISAMGLFLGNDPNGNSIWGSAITTEETDPVVPVSESIFYNQNDTRLITAESIKATMLPPCLQSIASIFSGVTDVVTGAINSPCPPNGRSRKDQNAFLFLPAATTDKSDATIPSIFSADELNQDPTYFGAFSLPLEYRKYGLRLELGMEFCDWCGLTIQAGVANIQQTTTGLISMTNGLPICATANSPTTGCVSANTTPVNLYNQLATNRVSPQGSSTSLTVIQGYFDDYISNNAQEIFDSECGLGINTCNFDAVSIEDVRCFLSFKRTYDVDRYTKNDNDEYNWPDMLFTPYAWIGGSVPIADKQNYKKLLSLPFGNNGHASAGGAVGFTFDFLDSVEIGVEAGGTYFFERSTHRPVPNHPLQRIVYPYSTSVKVQPGANGHFKALLSTYQFMNHISFWATYEIIQHRKDCYRLCNPADNFVTKTLTNTQVTVTGTAPKEECDKPAPTTKIVGTKTEQIFYPELLRCNSDWRMQFLNMAFVFDIQPGMQASIVWQQPISPRNAYYPVSILGTLSFMF